MHTSFHVRYHDCGRRLAIDRVSLFNPRTRIGAEDLFSYGYTCSCGCATEIDGVTGEGSEILNWLTIDELESRATHYEYCCRLCARMGLFLEALCVASLSWCDGQYTCLACLTSRCKRSRFGVTTPVPFLMENCHGTATDTP